MLIQLLPEFVRPRVCRWADAVAPVVADPAKQLQDTNHGGFDLLHSRSALARPLTLGTWNFSHPNPSVNNVPDAP